ncbi:MAG: hypothetical protein FJ014_00305 [Chloroflexi bacterium]|nr:hypothetical protein [Chloroflexota bacterium]
MNENALPFGYNFTSHETVLDFLSDQGYRVESTPWDISDLSDRARELIGSMSLVSHYDDDVAPFQVFLTELDVPRQVRRIRRTDLRIILEPFYRRYPQGDYLFIFALPNYASVALVSPKRIRGEPRHPSGVEALAGPAEASTPDLYAATAKLQLRILTLDPRHLYHTDLLVLEQIRLGPEDQTAEAIWRKHLAAFDVERVTRQFYEGYKTVLAMLKSQLAAQRRVGAMPAQVHAFAQQLLNRLMFLYFVQKKGWLRWNGEPDPHYLRSLWERYRDGKQTGDGGFHGWLQALFLDAFNNRRATVAANSALPDDVRASFLGMPFLNGGLFDQNDLDDLGFSVPDKFFVQLFDRFEREEPGFLERYNFTVDESTPLDVEVAVDPEMLGKVYESLVAEEERHAAGIFYTPREEIDYMCRLSLIEYLHEQTGYPKDDLIPLVMEPRRLLETPEACPERERGDGIVPFGGLSQTRQHEALRVVEKALREIRVVDPAVGSGSFLVGMMKALAEIQRVLAQKLERKRFNEFDRKRQIIMENLYGVDVKDWAVRACELRLWLSLTIEAEEQQIGLYTNPVLPKLSFRVRQGDSLVEEVAGVPLAMRGAQAVPTSLQKRLARLAQEKADFFGGRSLRKPDYIEREEQKLLVQFLNERIDEDQRQMDVLRREPVGTQPELGLEGVAPKGGSRAEEEAEARRQARIKALDDRRQELIKARTQLTTGQTPPFFVWEVGFGEVFAEKGGFDICIGNPPYVRQEEIGPPTENPDDYDVDEWRSLKQDYKDRLARSVQALWGSAARVDRKSDLYVYFYYAGLSLLREGGVFCFINSNSWLDVGYGARLQDFLLRQMRVLQVVDNQAERSFAQADINTVIVLLQQPKADGSQWEHVARFTAYRKPFEEVLTVPNLLAIERAADVARTDDLRVYPIAQRDLLLDGAELPEEAEQAAMDFAALETLKYQGGKWGGKFLRAPDIFFTILEKGKGKLVRLGEIAEVRRGFTTGVNEFFYLEPTGQPAPEGLVHVRNGAGWEGYLETEFLKPVIKSPREVRRIVVRHEDLRYKVFICRKSRTYLKRERLNHALAYIEWGEKQGYDERPTCWGRAYWWDLGEHTSPPIVMNKGVNDRHFVTLNSARALCDQQIYEVRVDEEDVIASLLGVLNWTGMGLFYELIGRRTFGEGVLWIAIYEAAALLTLDTFGLTERHHKRLKNSLELLSQRELKSIFEELGLPKPNRDYSNIDPNDVSLDKVLPDRRALDEVVFEALGLTEEEQLEVYRAVVELVKMRLSKAQSVRGRG